MTPAGPAVAVTRMRVVLGKAVRGILEHTYGRYLLTRPLDPDLVMYSSLWHRTPRGNPLAIFRAQREVAPGKRAVWVVRREDEAHVPDGIDHVRPRTLAYLRLLATAGTIVDDANPNWHLPGRAGQVYLQTHHGTALKYMGADRHYSGERPDDPSLVRVHERCQRWTYSLSNSPYLSRVWQRAYQNQAIALEAGSPRNDALVNPPPQRRAAARTRLGLGERDRAILYMPTWRERSGPRQDIDLTALIDGLGTHDRLLMRDHYFHDGRQYARDDAVTDVSHGWEVEDLYLAADVLVSDYSSAMFDFVLLDRPIVLFTYDWEEYRRDRGAYFDVTADAPGEVVTTVADLADALQPARVNSQSHQAARARYRELFAPADDGHAAERVARILFTGDDPTPWMAQQEDAPLPHGWTTHPPVTHPQQPGLDPLLAPM